MTSKEKTRFFSPEAFVLMFLSVVTNLTFLEFDRLRPTQNFLGHTEIHFLYPPLSLSLCISHTHTHKHIKTHVLTHTHTHTLVPHTNTNT